MLGLKDLGNANSFGPELATAVNLDELLTHRNEIEFGDRGENFIPIKFRGHGLRVNIPAKVKMGLLQKGWVAMLETAPELTKTLGLIIYSQLKEASAVKALVPMPDLEIGLSRLDQASEEGFNMAFETWDQLRGRVRCVTASGQSTSISCNLVYPATWTVDLSKVIFEPKATSEHLAESSRADFFVCLASPTVCITFDSPTENYGRFSK